MDAVVKDLAASTALISGGSPKTLYTSFLLGLVREYFGLIMASEVSDTQIESGFSCLVAFVPDREVRQKIWDLYIERRGNEGTQEFRLAAVSCTGELVDYFSEVLDLTESSSGAFL
jgi:hypothetical protein